MREKRDEPSDYIGTYTQQERQRLYYDNLSIEKRTIHGWARLNFPYYQSADDEKGWMTREEYNENTYAINSLVQKIPVSEYYRYGTGDSVEYVKGKPAYYYEKNTDYKWFEKVLNGGSLAVKRVYPLTSGFDEARRDVQTTYALAGLVYRHENVLSLNFVQILDWYYSAGGNGLTQVSILEQCDGASISVPPAQHGSVVFQVLHALEIAYAAYGFRHNNLLAKNVKLQRITKGSPLYDNNWLYALPGACDSYWYMITPEEHRNQLVKITNMERSTIGDAMPPQQTSDMKTFLTSFLGSVVDKPRENDKSYGFFATLSAKAKTMDYELKPGSIIESDLFKQMRVDSCVIMEKIASNEKGYVVVSFPKEADTPRASVPLLYGKTSSVQHNIACSAAPDQSKHCCFACDRGSPRFADTINNRLYCSTICHQFKTLFNGKTVHR